MYSFITIHTLFQFVSILIYFSPFSSCLAENQTLSHLLNQRHPHWNPSCIFFFFTLTCMHCSLHHHTMPRPPFTLHPHCSYHTHITFTTPTFMTPPTFTHNTQTGRTTRTWSGIYYNHKNNNWFLTFNSVITIVQHIHLILINSLITLSQVSILQGFQGGLLYIMSLILMKMITHHHPCTLHDIQAVKSPITVHNEIPSLDVILRVQTPPLVPISPTFRSDLWGDFHGSQFVILTYTYLLMMRMISYCREKRRCGKAQLQEGCVMCVHKWRNRSKWGKLKIQENLFVVLGPCSHEKKFKIIIFLCLLLNLNSARRTRYEVWFPWRFSTVSVEQPRMRLNNFKNGTTWDLLHTPSIWSSCLVMNQPVVWVRCGLLGWCVVRAVA